ncbi:MAG TPA: MarR family winged helix-turn-helix transcriptional regulator [Candidatus Binatia bacterium]|jgi:DNA-binding MarR family transcriptional regulator
MKTDDITNSPDYRALADFRHEIRRFVRFSENAARSAGLEPQQHQLLLALKGLPADKRPTISVLADRLQIQHHSAVELIDRLSKRRMVRRYRSRTDKRQVYVRLTQGGEDVLRQLSLHHLQEIRSAGPILARVLATAIASANESSESDGHSLDHSETDDPQRRAKR